MNAARVLQGDRWLRKESGTYVIGEHEEIVKRRDLFIDTCVTPIVAALQGSGVDERELATALERRRANATTLSDVPTVAVASLIERLIRLRIERQMTQDDVAELADMNFKNVSRIERAASLGRAVEFEALGRLARALGHTLVLDLVPVHDAARPLRDRPVRNPDVGRPSRVRSSTLAAPKASR